MAGLEILIWDGVEARRRVRRGQARRHRKLGGEGPRISNGGVREPHADAQQELWTNPVEQLRTSFQFRAAASHARLGRRTSWWRRLRAATHEGLARGHLNGCRARAGRRAPRPAPRPQVRSAAALAFQSVHTPTGVAYEVTGSICQSRTTIASANKYIKPRGLTSSCIQGQERDRVKVSQISVHSS